MTTYNDGLYTPWTPPGELTTVPTTSNAEPTSYSSVVDPTSVPHSKAVTTSVSQAPAASSSSGTTSFISSTTTTLLSTTSQSQSLLSSTPFSEPTSLISTTSLPLSSPSLISLPYSRINSTSTSTTDHHSSFKLLYLLPVFILLPILIALTLFGWSYKRCWGSRRNENFYYADYDDDGYYNGKSGGIGGGGAILTKDEEEGLVKGVKVGSSRGHHWLGNLLSSNSIFAIGNHAASGGHNRDPSAPSDFAAVGYSSLEPPFLPPSSSQAQIFQSNYTLPHSNSQYHAQNDRGWSWGRSNGSRTRKVRPKSGYKSPSFSSASSKSFMESLSRRPTPDGYETSPTPYSALSGKALEERSMALDSLLAESRVGGGMLEAKKLVERPRDFGAGAGAAGLQGLGKAKLSPTKKKISIVRREDVDDDEEESDGEEDEIVKYFKERDRKMGVQVEKVKKEVPMIYVDGDVDSPMIGNKFGDQGWEGRDVKNPFSGGRKSEGRLPYLDEPRYTDEPGYSDEPHPRPPLITISSHSNSQPPSKTPKKQTSIALIRTLKEQQHQRQRSDDTTSSSASNPVDDVFAPLSRSPAPLEPLQPSRVRGAIEKLEAASGVVKSGRPAYLRPVSTSTTAQNSESCYSPTPSSPLTPCSSDHGHSPPYERLPIPPASTKLFRSTTTLQMSTSSCEDEDVQREREERERGDRETERLILIRSRTSVGVGMEKDRGEKKQGVVAEMGRKTRLEERLLRGGV